MSVNGLSGFDRMGIDPRILRGMERMGFHVPFPIQERAIPALLGGRDVIGQAKTGSGKTAAFAVPLLQSVNPKQSGVQALVLAPTRELAVQIAHETQRIGEGTGARVLAVYGGKPILPQRESLRRGAQVVVGTPGRLVDHLERRWLDLSGTRFVVLDECDRMLDMGFEEDVEYIVERTPAERQTCLFSATVPREVEELARKYTKDPVKIFVDNDDPSVETLRQRYVLAERDGKLGTLVSILQEERPDSTIVFCRTKRGADILSERLQAAGFGALPLHSDLSQGQRDHSMQAFRSGHADVLVATDVASRGLDVTRVGLVVNFDVPADPLVYFHRVGRTARAGKGGTAYTLVSHEESADFARILRIAKAPIAPMREEDELRRFPGPRGHSHQGGRARPRWTRSRRRWRHGRR